MNKTFIIRSTRILAGVDATVVDGCLLVENGLIRAVTRGAAVPSGVEVIDVGTSVVMPGIVDTHAHINEPGRTEWEGFETATHAAAAGGITTLIDMPLNSIPATTSVASLEVKAATAHGRCVVDYGFWGGLVPGNSGELVGLAKAGVKGFKCFLIDSGVEEFKFVGERDLLEAMPIIAKTGLPLIVHAELDKGAPAEGDARSYLTYLHSRPKTWENSAVKMMIDLSRKTGCRVHIVHLSSAEAHEAIDEARNEQLAITVETCPHYLVFAAEEIPDGGTQFKCAPPIREKENRERLWDGLRKGQIDFIVSDHSPCTPQLKLREGGDFMHAWGGISSLQFGLSIIWTQLQQRKLGFKELVNWMCLGPANFIGLGSRKGLIAPGRDADFVVWNPEKKFTLDSAMIRHRHAVTPYLGQSLSGVVELTFLRGNKIYDNGQFLAKATGVRI